VAIFCPDVVALLATSLSHLRGDLLPPEGGL